MNHVLEVAIDRAGYPGDKEVIQQIHFSIKEGELVGLIGANGSGKSTTIKAILDMLVDLEGQIIFNKDDRRYAYIPEQPSFYEELTLWEHIEFAASVCELEEGIWEQRAEKLLKDFRMIEVIHHMPMSFSKGMQQKLMIILAFLTRPSLYIVDEPFVGLDPKATRQFISTLEEEKQRGAGVLMSTHVLDTAERICDKLLLIEKGRVIASGTLDEIREKANLAGGTLVDCFDHLVEW